MLDPRIYRTGFVAVALAVVVVAFSLRDQRGPLSSTLAPDAFSGQNADATMQTLARRYPQRAPGSAGDAGVADYVTATLRRYGYHVSSSSATLRTAVGRRTIETVIGSRIGLTPGSIVVVAHRDSPSSPGPPDLSGTATLLELARVLAGETQHHPILLVSTSGSAGASGATQLARTLSGPIDAVIALGDTAAVQPRSPVVIPWSDGDRLAPPLLRNTLAAALGSQTGLRPGGAGLLDQLAHLTVPMTLSEQGPFGDRGLPAIAVSLSGDHRPTSGEATSAQSATTLGRALLQTVDALDAGPTVPAAGSYLLFSGKIIPGWAIRLLVLALLAPVALTAVDGLARVRRRGYHPGRGMVRTLIQALPYALAALLLPAARLLGVLAAPPGPVGPGEVPLSGAAAATLGVVALVVVGGQALVRWRTAGGLGGASTGDGPDPGHAIGTLLILCLAVVAVWAVNPFAALVAIPAAHLWLWLLDPELRPHPGLAVVLLAGGLLAPAVIVVEYAHALSLSAPQTVWNGLLLAAGGAIGPPLLLAWSVMLGCLTSAVAVSIQAVRLPRIEDAPVTVRGPVTYAGPGSLGGTESALRR